jgi:hypothetical protein
MGEDKAAEKESRKLVDAARWLSQDFMKYARDERFMEAFAIGIGLYWNGYYTFEDAEAMGMNEAFRFFDWFVFDFQYEDTPRLIDSYHEEKYDDLTIQQQQVIDSWLDAPPAAAYELLDYNGQSLHIADFVTGEEFDIYEAGGHGPAEPGDLLLGRIVPVKNRREFSTVAAYLPRDEIADLSEKLENALASDNKIHPGATYHESMRRKGFIIIHHALEQAELNGRHPVARYDPDRKDNLARKAAEKLRKMQRL